jgi:hypothetical protein
MKFLISTQTIFKVAERHGLLPDNHGRLGLEDIERFMYDMPSHQKQQLMNFASSFIAFVEEHLIEDDNMRTVLAGIRILSKDI